MTGAILGDISGSTYEFCQNKNPAAELFPQGSSFTDDTIMTVATAEAILTDRDYLKAYQRYGDRYPAPMGGYGIRFARWLREPNPVPYGSWGNGAAMRVAPIGWAFESLEDALAEAKSSASVSHDHPEGIKGAQSTVAAIWLARNGRSKAEIKAYITDHFGYDLSRSIAEIRPVCDFDESCQGTVPEALTAFLESSSFEDALRIAISLGGDADTLGCIAGGIAEAFYREIPGYMNAVLRATLRTDLANVVDEFCAKYAV